MSKKQSNIHYSTPESEEYFLDEGCYILELNNTPDHSDLSIARARLEVGCETELHSLKDTAERYVIQQGEGIANIDGVEYSVKVNDVLNIAPDVAQKIGNTGTIDLIFLVICTPRFEPSCYQKLRS